MNPAVQANVIAPFRASTDALPTYTAPVHASSRGNSQAVILSIIAIDILLVFLALLSAFEIRFNPPVSQFDLPQMHHVLVDYMSHFLVGTAVLIFILFQNGAYTPEVLLSRRRTYGTLVKGATFWLVGYLAASLIFKVQPHISRLYCVFGFMFILAYGGAFRMLILLMVTRTKALESLHKRILLVGWNKSSSMLYEHVTGDVRHLHKVVGVIPAPGQDGFEQTPPKHIPSVGTFSELPTIFRSHHVDTVVVADLRVGGRQLVDLANTCERDMVDFKLIPSGFQILLSGLTLDHVSGVPVLAISQLPLQSPVNGLLKRAVDIVGALVGLTLSAPIMAVFGAMIYLESPGSIFYRQTRLGRNGRHFTIFKLRSMKLDSETTSGPRWAEQNDPRCLRVGAFMRRCNIDELPQFWNVLKGEMSLVGPRPERPELIFHFNDSIPHYNARHNIKPGMTGWAQVNGLRGNTDLTERVQHDLFYIENWSLLLDFQIMLSTFFTRKNAY